MTGSIRSAILPWLGRWFPTGRAVLVYALALGSFAVYAFLASRDLYLLEVKLASDAPASLRMVYDTGAGFGGHSTIKVVPASRELEPVQVPLSGDDLKAVRLEPGNGPATLRVAAVSVRTRFKLPGRPRLYHLFGPEELQAAPRVEETLPGGVDVLRVTAPPGGSAGQGAITVTPRAPLPLRRSWFYLGYLWTGLAVGWSLLWVAVEAGRRWTRPRLPGLVALWGRLSPTQAVWLVAAVSMVGSCYPVIFCGKSFASPNFSDGTFQLYGRFPTLPGTADTTLAPGNGADLGSLAWAHGPYSVVESRALFRDHELPLWNRYNYAGVPLLGQGQSMFGDPLHCLVLAAGGRAWAWDAKFVLARGLFAAGVGFLVLAATGCLPAALLLCFSSAFLGFFSYRLNHPGYFSLCYEPWILFAWLRIVRAATWRGAMRWAGGLILANGAEMNSGTAKEAYLNLLFLNGCGCLLLLASHRPAREKRRWLGGLLGAGIIFALLASPVLTAFLDTLHQSRSNYDEPHAFQLQPGLTIGLFDDIFYRQFDVHEEHLDPSLNFLVLVGVLLALSQCKRLARDRTFAVVAASALLPAALVFGVVPPAAIRATPLLGNVIHIDDTFSCILFIHLFVLAGFGLRACLELADRRAWGGDVLVAFLLGGGLLALYFGCVQAAMDTTAVTFLRLDQEIARSAFFGGYVPVIVAAALALPFILRQLRFHGPRFAPVLGLVLCLGAIHGRFGLQLSNPLGKYTPVLPNRVDLLATSGTVDWLHADRAGAFRVLGLGGNLMLGYSGVIDLENIVGPDALNNPAYRALENGGLEGIDGWFNRRVDPARVGRVKPFLDLLNVRYLLVSSGQGLGAVPGLTRVRQGDLDVYRDEAAWPRAFFVDRLGVYRGVEGFVAQVKAGDGCPFATVEDADRPSLPLGAERMAADPAGRTVVAATGYRLTNHRTAFDVDAPGPGVVVLTEGFMKGSVTAELDGRPAPVWRVNHAFRGIVVDRPGAHRVVFTYQPRGFTLALWAAGLGLGLLLAAGASLRPGADGLAGSSGEK